MREAVTALAEAAEKLAMLPDRQAHLMALEFQCEALSYGSDPRRSSPSAPRRSGSRKSTGWSGGRRGCATTRPWPARRPCLPDLDLESGDDRQGAEGWTQPEDVAAVLRCTVHEARGPLQRGRRKVRSAAREWDEVAARELLGRGATAWAVHEETGVPYSRVLALGREVLGVEDLRSTGDGARVMRAKRP